MNIQSDIVTLTMNPAVDKSSDLARVMPEKKLRCDAPQFEPGGGGINVARAIRKLGGDAAAFYPSGGYSGRFFEDLLEGEGIPHYPMAIRQTTRVNLVVREKETGQQFRFNMPGPALEADEWQQMLERLSSLEPFPKFLVVSGSLPPGVPGDFHQQLAGLVLDRKSRLLADSSGDPLRQALEQGVFLVKPNLRELRQIAGEDVQEEDQIAEAAHELVRSGRCRMVVVSLGRAGAFLASKSGSCWIRSPNVPVQSKVGAGDSMMAGLTLALSRGASEADAACFGVAAGAAAAMTPGSELCRRADTERLFKQVQANCRKSDGG